MPRARTRRIRTEIEGIDDVVDLLETIGDRAENILDDAAKAGARVVFNDAKRNCPVDTGNLRDSIELQPDKKTAKKATWKVTLNLKKCYYGRFVLLGTRKKPARPFLQQATDQNRNKIADAVNDTVSDALGI